MFELVFMELYSFFVIFFIDILYQDKLILKDLQTYLAGIEVSRYLISSNLNVILWNYTCFFIIMLTCFIFTYIDKYIYCKNFIANDIKIIFNECIYKFIHNLTLILTI